MPNPTDQRRLDEIEAALTALKQDYIAKCGPLRRERDAIRTKYRVMAARKRLTATAS